MRQQIMSYLEFANATKKPIFVARDSYYVVLSGDEFFGKTIEQTGIYVFDDGKFEFRMRINQFVPIMFALSAAELSKIFEPQSTQTHVKRE